MKKEELPFVYTNIATGADFAGREKETTQLLQNFNLGIHTILIAPPNLGKTSVIHKATAASRNKNILFCYLSLFNIRNEQEFCTAITNVLINQCCSKIKDKEGLLKKIFKKTNPDYSCSGNDLQIKPESKDILKHPDEIFNLSETICKIKKIKIVLCITHFQNISFFDEALSFYTKLHSFWKLHKHTTYCISVNKNRSFIDVFTQPSMPFYQFGDVLFVEKINTNTWINFIQKRFIDTGKEIEASCAQYLAENMENHPYFVQQLAQQSWLLTHKKCTLNEVNLAKEIICNRQTVNFQRETDLLTSMQLNLLNAICNNAKQLSSTECIHEYQLGTSANVIRMKEALVNKEIILTNGASIEFVNPLFKLWLKEVYFHR